jgi:dipeptidyl aminopeptidase/acylaminoacyl peptidase
VSSPVVAPFGSWRSPISSRLIVESGVTLSEVRPTEEAVYWLEGRPTEGGRSVVVRCAAGEDPADVTPEGFSARTRVHEYGGGAWVVWGRTVFFSNWSDQRVYRQDPSSVPRPITPEPALPAGARFADARVTADGQVLVCVRELSQDDSEPRNEIVAIPTDGSAAPSVLVSGPDFVSFPRISPDGRFLAWTSWDHPRMPWDGTELWVAAREGPFAIGPPRLVAGGPEESIFQPEWSPNGVLHFISDRSGWWNLYRDVDAHVEAIAPMEAEFGVPQWVFGLSTYAFVNERCIAAAFLQNGISRLGLIEGSSLRTLDLPYTSFTYVRAGEHELGFIAASSREPPAVLTLSHGDGATRDPSRARVLRRSIDVTVDAGYLSEVKPIEFPTENGRHAHALFYAPTNKEFAGPAGDRPPLVVRSHGGPTSAKGSALDLGIQYWTSRGFALVDVNYGGSTGYGREYRERLRGQWGVVDVDDCVNAARYLAERGDVDGQQMAITGGSAGGYTTLCALAFRDTFSAGASHFGVADAEALARDTHKFESRYLDGLIGPYPEAVELYRARSPIHFADKLSCPVILFQGLEDEIVPPSQAEELARALRANGLPFAYLTFEGEQHGFRKAENIRRALDGELYFYSRVFGFELADPLPPVVIENL